jgi:hypothetical protein
VFQAAFTEALSVTTSPMWMGCMKVMRSAPAVTTRRRAWRTAAARDLVDELHDDAVHEARRVGVGQAHQCTSTLRRIGDGAHFHEALR